MKLTRKFFSPGLNFDVVKILALLTMVIDHIGHILMPNEVLLRVIGRATFPLFAFLLSYHLAKKNIFKKYFIRLIPFALFATLLIMPFDFIVKGYMRLNIFWSFLCAIAPLFIIEKAAKEKINIHLKFFIYGLALSFFGALSYLCDYNLTGFILIISLYWYFKTNNYLFALIALIDSILINSESLLLFPKIVIPFILVTFITTLYLLWQSKYISQTQTRFLKPWWIFYLFYPVHFLIIYLIKIYWF